MGQHRSGIGWRLERRSRLVARSRQGQGGTRHPDGGTQRSEQSAMSIETMTMPNTTAVSGPVYNRVPRITAEFWLIKLMAVTMGETAADYLSVQMGLGLTTTSLLMTMVL